MGVWGRSLQVEWSTGHVLMGEVLLSVPDQHGMRRVLADIHLVVGGWPAVRIPAGYRSDGHSLPRWARWLADPWDGPDLPPVVHDYLYEYDPLSCGQQVADQVFFALHKRCGARWWRRYVYYTALRVGGGPAWRRARRRR